MVALCVDLVSLFLLVTSANAIPSHRRHLEKRGTHGTYVAERGLRVETYHPPSNFKTVRYGMKGFSVGNNTTIEAQATSFLSSNLNVDPTTINFRSGFKTEGSKFAYLKQSYNGINFANAVANIGWRDGRIVSFGSSFVSTEGNIADPIPSINLTTILPEVEEMLGGKHNDHPPALEYLAQADGTAALVHVVQIQNKETGTWVEAFVDAHSGDLRSVTNFVTTFAYSGIPIRKQSPDDGIETIDSPMDFWSSPLGWHNNGETTFNYTAGNNAYSVVIDYPASSFAIAVPIDDDYNFVYQADFTQDPTKGVNPTAAQINAFYVMNVMHDITFRYGFTETAANFQTNNWDYGGEEGDPVIVSVHDTSGLNNADFSTPPDGQSGICRMFLWDLTYPRRDGAFMNDILIHEYGHGVSNRLTGGGTGRCLQTIEAGGMGEGWSDFFADWLSQTSSETHDFTMGAYAMGGSRGFRTAPYSTNPEVNSLTYSSVATRVEGHMIGEVWANMLHNVYADLVEQWGFSTEAHTDPSTFEGNVIMLRNVMDGMMLQPCNPTFVDARIAIIQADESRYHGIHSCVIWRTFARLGLGLNARKGVYENDYSVPTGC